MPRAPLHASRVKEEHQPRWIDLPRPRTDFKELSNVEIYTGRLAMVGFFGLLAGEVISQQTFGQQILTAVSHVTGN